MVRCGEACIGGSGGGHVVVHCEAGHRLLNVMTSCTDFMKA
jgi:hypothetical protein